MIAAPDPQTLKEALVKRLGLVSSKRAGLALAVWGEPGVGKSWLGEQVLRQLTCQSLTVHAGAPFALRGLLPPSSGLPVWVERSLEQLSELSPAKAADALSAYLSSLAPFVLRIEDLHEAGPEGLELWLALARATVRVRGVGLLFSTRTPPPEPLETFALGSLSLETSVELLQGRAGAALPTEACEWIFARAQGNPLFTLEYFRHLSRVGNLWSDGSRWRWRTPESDLMPTSIEALLVQLLYGGQLSPEAGRVLELRALLSDPITPELTAQAAGVSPERLQEALAQLEGAGLLLDGEFVHPLFREVLLREMRPAERQRVAARLVEVLQDTHPERAARFLPDAGFEPGRALALLRRAADSSPSGPERAHFLAQAAAQSQGAERAGLALEAALILRDFSPQKALEQGALSLEADPHNPEALALQAKLLLRLGQPEAAEHWVTRLPDSDPRKRSLGLEVLYARGRFAEAVELGQGGPDTACLVWVAQSQLQLGRLEEAKLLLHEALRAASLQPQERAWLLRTYADIPLHQGDFAEASRALGEALEFYHRVEPADPAFGQTQRHRAEALFTRAVTLYRWGRFPQAIADLEAYLRYVGEQGDGRSFARGQANLGLLLIEVGEYERAEEALLESRTVFERGQNQRMLAVVGQGLVRLYLDWSPPHGGAMALKSARAAEAAARKSGSAPFLAETLAFVAWAEAVHGQPRQAEQLAAEIRGHGVSRLSVFADWVEGLALERLGRAEEAERQIKGAVEAMHELGHAPFAHRMGLELDRLKHDRRTAMRRVQTFEEVGNPNWANIARRYFPADLEPSPEAEEAGLEVGVLGAFQLTSAGEPLGYSARKGQELLALLLEARLSGRGEVEVLELYDALYPEMDEDKAASALKQLVYRLRGALGSAAVTKTAAGYALGAVGSDAERFLRGRDTRLWRGPYLHGLGEGWDGAVGDSLYHTLHEAARALTASDPEEALRCGRILLEADPYSPEALRLCLEALRSGGNAAGLERFYRAQRERFAEVGERLPERWQAFLGQDRAA